MDLSGIIAWLSGMFPWFDMVLMAAGALYVLGMVYVAVTPNEKDDGIIAWIEAHPILGALAKLLVASSPIQRKPKK